MFISGSLPFFHRDGKNTDNFFSASLLQRCLSPRGRKRSNFDSTGFPVTDFTFASFFDNRLLAN